VAPHVQPCRPARRHGQCACSRSAVGHGLQFIEHGGDIPRHVDMIGCGMAGLSLLDGALDVNGEGGPPAGRPGRIQQAPDSPHHAR